MIPVVSAVTEYKCSQLEACDVGKAKKYCARFGKEGVKLY